MWWLIPGIAATLACALSSIPYGVWVLAKSELPAWVKGPWKWPLGEHLSPQVVVLQGWANLFVGSASLILAVLLVFLPTLAAAGLPDRLMIDAVLFLCVVFVLCGTAAYVWSVVLSRRAQSSPPT